MPSSDIITIVGKKENVKAVRAELEASVKLLEEQITDEISVEPKWHVKFIARRGLLINKISEENGNVRISFPKLGGGNPNNNNNNTQQQQQQPDIVTLKGTRNSVESAKKSILDLVYEFENRVTIEVNVPQKYHVSIIGKLGVNSQQIIDDHKVELQFPAKSSAEAAAQDTETTTANGEENNDAESTSSGSNKSPAKTSDIIRITGLADNCEKAKQDILALVPVSERVSFPKRFHKDLVANKAELLIELSNANNIQIKVPKREDESANYLTVIGLAHNLEAARKELEAKLVELEIKNYSVDIFDIKSDVIPKLRGRQNQETERMEKKYDVKIDFSRKGESDRITIRGIKKNVDECEAFIRKKIKDEESKISQEIKVDPRVHSRIIGAQVTF